MKKRVVVTGIGLITPIGLDFKTSWENAKAGVLGIDKITAFGQEDAASLLARVSLAAEVKGYDELAHFTKKDARRYAKFTQFAVVAAREAVKMSGLDIRGCRKNRVGTIVSSGIGGLDIITEEHKRGNDKGFERVSPFFIPMSISNMAAGAVAIDLGAHGMSTAPVTACAGGTNAIGDAFRNIRDGYLDAAITGGTESSMIPLALGGFASMRALSESTDKTRASIPFDKDRGGFVMGEGAGVLVLEELEHALARGAEIYGEILGYGSTSDAYHMSAPLEGGEYQADCMVLATEDAGISPKEVGYVNAHGTSTPMNDKTETAAIKAAFPENYSDLYVSSTKSMTGHLLGASGAVEAAFSIMAIREGIIPPTIGYKNPDPECDLNIVPNKAVKADISAAISNSFGFGGHNACLVFGRFKDGK